MLAHPGRAGCRRSTTHTAAHIQAQLPCLTTAGGGWALDFLGRVEEIDRDLNAILAVLDARRAPGVPRLGQLRARLGNANGRRCRHREGECGALGLVMVWWWWWCSGVQVVLHASCLPACLLKGFRFKLDSNTRWEAFGVKQ